MQTIFENELEDSEDLDNLEILDEYDRDDIDDLGKTPVKLFLLAYLRSYCKSGIRLFNSIMASSASRSTIERNASLSLMGCSLTILLACPLAIDTQRTKTIVAMFLWITNKRLSEG